MRLPRLAVLLLAFAAALTFTPRGVSADEGWVIRSFDAEYAVGQDGTLAVTEDILVDFGTLERHGIFRDIPFEYTYEPEPGVDTKQDRLITISNVSVDDGATPQPFTVSYSGGTMQIKIGDADVLVTGEQRYRIQYVVLGGLNPFDTHDELFWNVTGDDWPVTIETARATLRLPGPGIQQIACYQGETGSSETCLSDSQGGAATFAATRALPPDAGMTLVVALRKGLVAVPPLALVPRPDESSPAAEARDFLGPSPLSIALGAVLSVAVLGLVGYQWWRIGRDRWYGDTYYLSEDAPSESTKPPFAHKTIVVGYTPPEVIGDGRRLHPAEIGLLLDERADTLDVSATIVDLAVRKHLVIQETPDTGILGLFKGPDYMLSRLEQPDADLLPYERKLLDTLFDDGETVKMSELKGKFHEDLQKVKDLLYRDAVKKLKLFPRDPASVRSFYQQLGVGVIVAGALAGVGLGYVAGVALVALPVIVGGGALMLLAPAMPRRSALGWEMFRRCLGFRLYMVTAETDRQRFAEQANIFHEYLPYAIVYGCVEKWAKAFEGLDLQPDAGYYVGTHPFAPLAFAESVNSFSGSVTSVMASTPGGSGGSGFSGGGSSGGGVGGGGGGSW